MAIRAGLSSLQETVAPSITITKCWSWSIQPIVIWIRILGVNLPDVYSTSYHNRCFMIFYGVFCFVANLLNLITILYYLNVSQIEDKLEFEGGHHFDTAVATWNLIIDYCNYAISGVGIHLLFLVVIRPRWLGLLEIFQRSQVTLNGKCFNRMRKMSLLGVAYIIFTISGLAYTIVGYHYRMGSSVFRMGTTFLSTMSAVYPMTGLLLYVLCCYASSLIFESIRTDIKSSQQIYLGNDHSQSVSILLLTCKRRHIFACDSVDAINYCLGSMLLIATAFFFVAIVNSSFYLFIPEEAAVTLPDLLFSIAILFHFTVMCFSTDRIRNKSEDAMHELLRLKYDEPIIGSKPELMNSFSNLLSEMSRETPEIFGGGYFSISKKLFLKVMGTTLTYFFILYQFKTSETYKL